MDMDEEKKRKKERVNESFSRNELGALLRLFSALGITVAVGITGFFLLGLYLDRKLVEAGVGTHGMVRAGMVLVGVGMSVYWAYLRIARHLERFDPPEGDGGTSDESSAAPGGVAEYTACDQKLRK